MEVLSGLPIIDSTNSFDAPKVNASEDSGIGTRVGVGSDIGVAKGKGDGLIRVGVAEGNGVGLGSIGVTVIRGISVDMTVACGVGLMICGGSVVGLGN